MTKGHLKKLWLIDISNWHIISHGICHILCELSTKSIIYIILYTAAIIVIVNNQNSNILWFKFNCFGQSVIKIWFSNLKLSYE